MNYFITHYVVTTDSSGSNMRGVSYIQSQRAHEAGQGNTVDKGPSAQEAALNPTNIRILVFDGILNSFGADWPFQLL